MSSHVLNPYNALIRDGVIEPDPAQARVAAELDRLADALTEHQLGQKSGALGWLFGSRRPAAARRPASLHRTHSRCLTWRWTPWRTAAP